MIDVPTLLLSDVAKAAQIDLGLLRQWVSRGNLPLSQKDRQEGLRVVTIRTGYIIAIAARLVEHGIAISRAATAAWAAADDWEEKDLYLVLYTTEERQDRKPNPTEARVSLYPDTESLTKAVLEGDTVQTVVNCRKIIEDFDANRLSFPQGSVA